MLKYLKIFSICISLTLLATVSLAVDFGANSATLTHSYFPMKVGDKLTYRSYGFPEVLTVWMEAQAVEIIDGVKCLKLYVSVAYVSEAYSYLWLAQGTTGDIWVLKEFDAEFDEEIYFGKDNAKKAIPKNLSVGTVMWYESPNSTPELVVATGVTVPVMSTGLGPYFNCVKTRIDWGDGDIDYSYYAPGVGYVKEEFNDFGGINGIELKEIVSGVIQLTADFTADPLLGNVPLNVNFIDQSNGAISSWLWDFGDGVTSSAQNPSHTYSTPASYSVSLKVTGPDGSNTKTADNLITVNPSPALPWINLLLLNNSKKTASQ